MGPVAPGLLVGIVVAAALFVSASTVGGAEPSDFVDELVTALPGPTMAGDWLPDGRLLVLEQGGDIRIVDTITGSHIFAGAVGGTVVQDQRGTLDLRLHPEHPTNHRVLVYRGDADPEILQLELVEGDPAATSASVGNLWENSGPASPVASHVGGTLEITAGADPKILLSVGDAENGGWAQQLDRIWGKVLRLNLDGTIPTDNGFHDDGDPTTGNMDEIHHIGLRNPFRGWFDPVDEAFWIADVGGNDHSTAFEEINRLTGSGLDLGWPTCEGSIGCGAGVTEPWYAYDHDPGPGTQNRSVTGGEIYRGDAMPEGVHGSYVFGDWAINTLSWIEIEPDGSSGAVHDFPLEGGAKRPVWISVGPDGSIYYLRYDFAGGGTFELRRVRYTGELPPCPAHLVTVDIGAGEQPTPGDDVILGTAGADVIHAGDGNDVVCAGDGDDTVVGGAGDDLVLGEEGDDMLSGNDGADTIDGGVGSDRAFGGSGDDVIRGGDGDDALLGGGSGSDRVDGGAGDDRVTGGSDDDQRIDGGEGADTVLGGSGADSSVFGGPGDDAVAGNGGRDNLHGEGGNDTLYGGPNDDVVYGGEGDDFLGGNDGVDVCDGGPEVTADVAAPNCEIVLDVP